jgi:hypothetical protein
VVLREAINPPPVDWVTSRISAPRHRPGTTAQRISGEGTYPGRSTE